MSNDFDDDFDSDDIDGNKMDSSGIDDETEFGEIVDPDAPIKKDPFTPDSTSVTGRSTPTSRPVVESKPKSAGWGPILAGLLALVVLGGGTYGLSKLLGGDDGPSPETVTQQQLKDLEAKLSSQIVTAQTRVDEAKSGIDEAKKEISKDVKDQVASVKSEIVEEVKANAPKTLEERVSTLSGAELANTLQQALIDGTATKSEVKEVILKSLQPAGNTPDAQLLNLLYRIDSEVEIDVPPSTSALLRTPLDEATGVRTFEVSVPLQLMATVLGAEGQELLPPENLTRGQLRVWNSYVGQLEEFSADESNIPLLNSCWLLKYSYMSEGASLKSLMLLDRVIALVPGQPLSEERQKELDYWWPEYAPYISSVAIAKASNATTGGKIRDKSFAGLTSEDAEAAFEELKTTIGGELDALRTETASNLIQSEIQAIRAALTSVQILDESASVPSASVPSFPEILNAADQISRIDARISSVKAEVAAEIESNRMRLLKEGQQLQRQFDEQHSDWTEAGVDDAGTSDELNAIVTQLEDTSAPLAAAGLAAHDESLTALAGKFAEWDRAILASLNSQIDLSAAQLSTRVTTVKSGWEGLQAALAMTEQGASRNSVAGEVQKGLTSLGDLESQLTSVRTSLKEATASRDSLSRHSATLLLLTSQVEQMASKLESLQFDFTLQQLLDGRLLEERLASLRPAGSDAATREELEAARTQLSEDIERLRQRDISRIAGFSEKFKTLSEKANRWEVEFDVGRLNERLAAIDVELEELNERQKAAVVEARASVTNILKELMELGEMSIDIDKLNDLASQLADVRSTLASGGVPVTDPSTSGIDPVQLAGFERRIGSAEMLAKTASDDADEAKAEAHDAKRIALKSKEVADEVATTAKGALVAANAAQLVAAEAKATSVEARSLAGTAKMTAEEALALVQKHIEEPGTPSSVDLQKVVEWLKANGYPALPPTNIPPVPIKTDIQASRRAGPGFYGQGCAAYYSSWDGADQEAAVYFARAVECQPDNVIYRYFYGLALHRIERHEEAVAQVTYAAQLEEKEGRATYREFERVRGESRIWLERVRRTAAPNLF
ncbi:MAG: hypothetical protein R3C18_08405 [Planctomycetaceae bacterium]